MLENYGHAAPSSGKELTISELVASLEEQKSVLECIVNDMSIKLFNMEPRNEPTPNGVSLEQRLERLVTDNCYLLELSRDILLKL